ncbi:MAG: DUF1501 domain-containing protein [Proteobacteria bacterium]|nr:DUF1501 domain-containing protein [Pseudomonadota bacterium]
MRALKRREFLRTGALALGGAFLTSRLAFARTDTSNARFVFIIMRGALDGLAAAPPFGDPDYAGLRRELAIKAPGSPGGALPLNGFFGLHPSLGFLHHSYTAKELVVFHAVASPYRERSHFDGQDVLENGTLQPHAVQTGWLNRALASVQAGHGKELGVALGQNFPLVMRGPASVTSWSPSKLAALDDDTLERITDLYAGDPLLASRLADALAADAIASAAANGAMATNAPRGALAGGAGGMAEAADAASVSEGSPPTAPLQRGKPMRYTEVVRAAAGFLRREDGPQVAVFDTTGWDTHANEGSAEGQLAGRLVALDAGLRTLRDELGPAWAETAVLLATEFGRTAATNGTRGTDHGTATAAFLLGGAVQGGRVVADWPGLSSRSLYQGRDLKPTADLRSVLKGVLSEHLLVSSLALESTVFPSSADVRPIKGLFRA